MKDKNLHCTGQAYVRQLLKRLVYGTPIRCSTTNSLDQPTIPEYPIVYQREATPDRQRRERQEVVF